MSISEVLTEGKSLQIDSNTAHKPYHNCCLIYVLSPHFLTHPKASVLSTVFSCASAPTIVNTDGTTPGRIGTLSIPIAATSRQEATSIRAAELPCGQQVESATPFDIMVAAASVEPMGAIPPLPPATTAAAITTVALETSNNAIIANKTLTMSIEYDDAKTELGNIALALTKPITDKVSM